MQTEKITVHQPESGKTLEVVVLHKRADHIEVVIGEGVHSVKCDLSPSQNGKVYVGKVMGRELDSADVYYEAAPGRENASH